MASMRVLCVFLFVSIGCNAIGIEKITNAIALKGIGEMLPASMYKCARAFQIASNCGTLGNAACGTAMSGIFDQSWDVSSFFTPPGTTASSYLMCQWTGSTGGGECVPMAAGNSANLCYIQNLPTPSASISVSLSVSKSPIASVSTSAGASSTQTATASVTVSPTSAASATVSPTPAASPTASYDPWAACYASATDGYNMIPWKMGSVENANLNVGDTYSVDLSPVFCDPEDEALTYTIEGQIPAGLVVSGSTISGTVTTTGHFQLQAYAWDNSSNPPSTSVYWWIDVAV